MKLGFMIAALNRGLTNHGETINISPELAPATDNEIKELVRHWQTLDDHPPHLPPYFSVYRKQMLEIILAWALASAKTRRLEFRWEPWACEVNEGLVCLVCKENDEKMTWTEADWFAEELKMIGWKEGE